MVQLHPSFFMMDNFIMYGKEFIPAHQYGCTEIPETFGPVRMLHEGEGLTLEPEEDFALVNGAAGIIVLCKDNDKDCKEYIKLWKRELKRW